MIALLIVLGIIALGLVVARMISYGTGDGAWTKRDAEYVHRRNYL